MLAPFFSAAMIAPGRHGAFRRATIGHLLFLIALAWALETSPTQTTLTMIGHALLAAGIIEGGVLVGWRLTQLPKSQALEFVLTSPLQPRRFFLAEALVGLSRLALLTLSGLPILLLMLFTGRVESFDLLPMLLMPFTWGAITGIGLAVWTYEPRMVRKIGELLSMFGILVYLTVGVLAAERLKTWLQELPPDLGQFLFDGFQSFHELNPFGVMQYWLDSKRIPSIALERMIGLQLASSLLLFLLLVRGAFRLKAHFAELHYSPISSDRLNQSQFIGEKPLSWWAVRRVMVYSGRVNLWLAGGFSVLYSAYIMAGDDWPPWMGRLVFQIFERMGGAPTLITGMMILAAVPAAFQYGLWDSNTQDRCRRLELLLLTELNAMDYWQAAHAAAWRRGRGYFVIALMMWGALLYAGQLSVGQFLASLAAGVILWNFSFVIGFFCFSTGRQANGIGSLLTLGLPLLTVLGMKLQSPFLASLTPPGAVFVSMAEPPNCIWAVGPTLIACFTLWLGQRSLSKCDGNLRSWYDVNHGVRMVD